MRFPWIFGPVAVVGFVVVAPSRPRPGLCSKKKRKGEKGAPCPDDEWLQERKRKKLMDVLASSEVDVVHETVTPAPAIFDDVQDDDDEEEDEDDEAFALPLIDDDDDDVEYVSAKLASFSGGENGWLAAVPAEMAEWTRKELDIYGIAMAENLDDLTAEDDLCFGDDQSVFSDDDDDDCLTATKRADVSAAELALSEARFVYRETSRPTIAEHTILLVDPMNETTGYRVDRIDARAEKLLARLVAVSPATRKARFVSGVALVYNSTLEFSYTFEVMAEMQYACVSRCAQLGRCESLREILLQAAAAKIPMATTNVPHRVYPKKVAMEPVRRRGSGRLKQRLKEDALVLPNGNIDVSAFMGQSVDITLLDECADEIIARVSPLYDGPITKVLTTGTSGQQLALPVARALHVPLAVARRECLPTFPSSPLGPVAYTNSIEVSYQSKHFGPGQQLFLPKDALHPTDHVLIVDDFLASGSCQEAMLRLVERARAKSVAISVLIEKSFEGGRQRIARHNDFVPVIALATISSVDDGDIALVSTDAAERISLRKGIPQPRRSRRQ